MRLAFTVEYDGTEFCGWQRQQGQRTVQGCVEKALSIVADQSLQVVCAGRTDAGVHATGQVIHVDTAAERKAKGWLRGANSNLPGDVRLHRVAQVSEDFHARFSALRRHYRYIILNSPTGPALLRHRTCWQYAWLDEDRMSQAAAAMLGEHDFTSFRAAACQASSPVRTIYRLEITRRGDFVYIDIVANAFLHHMVRCVAGVLMAIGRGERSCDWVRELIDARDRSAAGVTASASGLYLVGVEYPGHFSMPQGGWLPTCG